MSGNETRLWRDLSRELSHWRSQGISPRIFLRDDDAVDDTPALQHLLSLCEQYDTPLLLATVPEPATNALAEALEKRPLITPAVHGYQHVDHSAFGEKACELGTQRPVDQVLDELAAGREKLVRMFGARLSAILVPPWNRIHDAVRDRVPEIGFKAISAHGWLRVPSPVPMINAHVDIVHWSGGGEGRKLDWVQSELLRNLEIARNRGGRAIGLLTHHLAHDEQAWRTLDQVLAWCKANEIEFVTADGLIEEAAGLPGP